MRRESSCKIRSTHASHQREGFKISRCRVPAGCPGVMPAEQTIAHKAATAT